MALRAVLFDLDGTLVDSLADIGESMNEVLREKGLPEHSLGDYRALVGDGVTMLTRRALPEAWAADEALVATCVARMRQVYGARPCLKTEAYPGVDRLLDGLQARGLALAVLSNKPHDLTVRVVAQVFPGRPFSPVFGERAGVPRKPDPTSAIEVAALLGLAPAEVLYVGDTPTDMRTALAAGMPAVGVLWGFRGEAELRESGAAAVAAHPEQVLELLGG